MTLDEAGPALAAAAGAAGVPGYAFVYGVVVEPADIDEQGHVNNAVYLRWLDRAAVAHSAALGWDWAAYQRAGAAFVVRRHEVDYLAPAFAGERLVDLTWPAEMGRASAVRHHRVVRPADGVAVLRARTAWAYVGLSTGRPVRIPAELRAAFETLGYSR